MRWFVPVAVGVLTIVPTHQVHAAPPAHVEEIGTHLEFLGYEVTTTDEYLRATHPSNLNVALKEHRGGILLLSYLGASTYGKEHPEEVAELANALNVNATVARCYRDKDGDLALEAWYPGTYEKTRFSRFIEEWHKDTINQLREHTEEIDKLFD